jgi:hypothetical protein
MNVAPAANAGFRFEFEWIMVDSREEVDLRTVKRQRQDGAICAEYRARGRIYTNIHHRERNARATSA